MIYAVTAAHNRLKITKAFAESLLDQTCADDLQLLLIDDGCTDGTAEMISAMFNEAVILHGNGDLWWGGALHEAYKWLKDNADDSDIVLFSNDDVQYDSDYIQHGVDMLKGRDLVLVSGLGMDHDTGEVFDTPVCWNFETLDFVRTTDADLANCVSTRSLFFTVSTMKLIGGFHPILLPHYASDYEWTIRAVRKGCRIECDDALSYRASFKTTGNRKRSIRQLLSKKSNFNPFYRFTFIILITPVKLIPKVLAIQIGRLFK